MNTFADGVFVRENLARKRLANDDHRCRAVLIAIVEVTTPDDRNAHRAEITDTRREEFSDRLIFRRHRPWIDRAGRLNSRRRLKTTLEVDKELALPLEVVLDFRQGHVERENILRLQTAVHVS